MYCVLCATMDLVGGGGLPGVQGREINYTVCSLFGNKNV